MITSIDHVPPKRIVNTSTRKLPLMSTDVNCGLSQQLTGLLVNPYTCQLTQRGIPHFTPLPMGEGLGEGPVGLLLFCFFCLRFCFFILTANSLQISRS